MPAGRFIPLFQVHEECACIVTHHNFPHRFRGNQSAFIGALHHLPVTSWAKPISNNYAIIEKNGVFKADLEESISMLWDKLVSVLHQAITGCFLKDFVPVL